MIWKSCDEYFYNDYIYYISRFIDLILRINNPINYSNIYKNNCTMNVQQN